MMKKINLSPDAINDQQELIYSYLYENPSIMHKQIIKLTQSYSPFLFPNYPLYFVDQSQMLIESSFIDQNYCDYMDIHNINQKQLQQIITQTSQRLLISDIPGKFYRDLISKHSTRKVVYIINQFSIDKIITRQELFREKNVKYFQELKRSTFQQLLRNLNISDFIYNNSNSSELYQILHNFYFFASYNWRYNSNDQINLQMIKSFISQTSDNSGDIDQQILQKDLNNLIFQINKRSKQPFKLKLKHTKLDEKIQIQIGVQRSVRTIFQYFPTITKNLHARALLTDILSFYENKFIVDFKYIQLFLQLISPLKDKWPSGAMDIQDIWIKTTPEDYTIPEVLRNLQDEQFEIYDEFSDISDQQ